MSSLSQADFGFIQQLVERHSAIVLSADQGYLAEARLQPVAQQAGLTSVTQLVMTLRSRPYEQLHKRVVEALTTNETSFFRDLLPFDALRTVLIPAVLQRRPNAFVQIWSAACSTGQEPYSIAMTVMEHFPQLVNRLRIFATDLNEQVLERAKLGRYTQLEVNRGLPAPMLIKHFTRQGMDWEIKPELRRMVDFRPMNLVGPPQHVGEFDIVFMRNVLIYFDLPKRREALALVKRNLAPGGALLLGTAETTHQVDEDFVRQMANKTPYYSLK